MNKAQKRTWLRLLISMGTLLIASIFIIYFRSSGIDIYDFSTPARIRRYILLGVLSAIPLILIVVIDWGWKKVYDERDSQIDRQAVILGAVGAFVFLAGAGWFLTTATRMGSVKAVLIMLLVYLAYFVWNLVLSIVALIQYGRGAKGEKS
ncbi:MAG: hypothetical protein ACYTEL_14385 [Planctomycetota bacterium]|jgi:hypothetical protein